MTSEVQVLQRLNLIYGALMIFLLSQFGSAGSWKSFVVGWTISVVNLEALRRIGLLLINFYNGERLDPLFYGFVIVKFSLWGLIMALFSLMKWIEAVPFVLGNATLAITGVALCWSMREKQTQSL